MIYADHLVVCIAENEVYLYLIQLKFGIMSLEFGSSLLFVDISALDGYIGFPFLR